jgi:hypothetical protein
MKTILRLIKALGVFVFIVISPVVFIFDYCIFLDKTTKDIDAKNRLKRESQGYFIFCIDVILMVCIALGLAPQAYIKYTYSGCVDIWNYGAKK